MRDREFLYWLQGRLDGETYIRDEALEIIKRKLEETLNKTLNFGGGMISIPTDGPQTFEIKPQPSQYTASWDLGGSTDWIGEGK